MLPRQVRGVVRGRTIELESDPGFEEGQEVEVRLSPVVSPEARLEALRALAGSLSHLPDEVFEELDEIVRERKRGDPG